MTLRELTQHANLGLSGSTFWIWFDGCELKGNHLVVPSERTRDDVTRLFLARLRGVEIDGKYPFDGLQILVQPPKPEPVKSKLLKKSAPQEIHDLWGKR